MTILLAMTWLAALVPMVVSVVGILDLSRRRSIEVCEAAPKTPATSNDVSPSRFRLRTSGFATAVLAIAAIGGLLIPAILGLLISWSISILRTRQRRVAQQEQIAAGLAEVIDLFAVALAGGHNLASAIRQVGRWAHGDLGRAIRSCTDETTRGRALSDVLETLPQSVSPALGPLVQALVAHDRYGAPIGESLTRLASDVRTDRRRRAETAARQMPVAMLFPLVTCVLPAFILLTVAPLVAQTLSQLNLFASS